VGSFPEMYNDLKIKTKYFYPKNPGITPPPPGLFYNLAVNILHHTCQFCSALGRIFLEGNLCVLKAQKKGV